MENNVTMCYSSVFLGDGKVILKIRDKQGSQNERKEEKTSLARSSQASLFSTTIWKLEKSKIGRKKKKKTQQDQFLCHSTLVIQDKTHCYIEITTTYRVCHRNCI